MDHDFVKNTEVKHKVLIHKATYGFCGVVRKFRGKGLKGDFLLIGVCVLPRVLIIKLIFWGRYEGFTYKSFTRFDLQFKAFTLILNYFNKFATLKF